MENRDGRGVLKYQEAFHLEQHIKPNSSGMSLEIPAKLSSGTVRFSYLGQRQVAS